MLHKNHILTLALFLLAGTCLPPFPAARVIEVKTKARADTYYFCKDGTVRLDLALSDFLNHKRFGTYEPGPEKIRIVWNRELGSKGVGKPFNCSTECVYPNYRPFQKKIFREETIEFQKMREQGSVAVYRYDGVCDPFWH